MKRKDYTVKTMGRLSSPENKIITSIIRAKSPEQAIEIAEEQLKKIGMGGMISNAFLGVM